MKALVLMERQVSAAPVQLVPRNSNLVHRHFVHQDQALTMVAALPTAMTGNSHLPAQVNTRSKVFSAGTLLQWLCRPWLRNGLMGTPVTRRGFGSSVLLQAKCDGEASPMGRISPLTSLPAA